MARPLRIQFAGAFNHVMNRGSSRSRIFLEPRQDREMFLGVLHDAHRLWKIKIHAYSLMDNHYHLLIETPLPNLSRAMRHIDGVYTQRFNKIYGRDGALLRGRFKSKLIQTEKYFLQVVRYIHLNGVSALKYPSADLDPDCSHPFYLMPNQSPAWLTQETVLSYFGDEVRLARQRFHDFVSQGVPLDVRKILDRKRWPAIFGDDSFVQSIKARFLTKKNPHPEKPQEKILLKMNSQLPEPEWVLDCVAKVCGQPIEFIVKPQATRSIAARRIAMFSLRYFCQLPYREIGQKMGGVRGGAVGKVCREVSIKESDQFKLLEEKIGQLVTS